LYAVTHGERERSEGARWEREVAAGRRHRRRVKKGGRGRAGAPILRARRGRRPACFAAWILHIYAQTVQAPVCAAGWAERGRAQEAAPTPD
jgi:hypothetical protein